MAAGVVIVGAGLAAAHVISTLREAGDDRPVTLLGDEGEPPYERPGLSKSVLQAKAEADSLYVHDRDWYGQHAVDARFADPAVALDVAQHSVRLASGAVLAYDDVVIATG
ncbi:MAG: FAD-dependent oxidoreductase, partial [Propionicimonas sp.]